MLPSELLIHRPRGDSIDAKQLPLSEVWPAIASNLIALFQATVGDTQGSLNQKLQALEGEDTDYRIKRGLAHILRSSFSTFEMSAPWNLRTYVSAYLPLQLPVRHRQPPLNSI